MDVPVVAVDNGAHTMNLKVRISTDPSEPSTKMPPLTQEDLGEAPPLVPPPMPRARKQVFGYILKPDQVLEWAERFPDVGLELVEDVEIDSRYSFAKCRLLTALEHQDLADWRTAYTCDAVFKDHPAGSPLLISMLCMGDNMSEKGLKRAMDAEHATRLRDFLGRTEPPRWFDVHPDYSRSKKLQTRAS